MNTPKIISKHDSDAKNERNKVLLAKSPVKIVNRKISDEPIRTVPKKFLKRKISDEPVNITQRKITDEARKIVERKIPGELVKIVQRKVSDEPAKILRRKILDEPVKIIPRKITDEANKIVERKIPGEPVKIVQRKVSEESIRIVQKQISDDPVKIVKRKISDEPIKIARRKISDESSSKISESSVGKLVTLIRKVKTDSVEFKTIPSSAMITHNHGTRSKVSLKSKTNPNSNGELEVPLKITVVKEENIDEEEESNELESNELESNELESNELESNELESNELESNELESNEQESNEQEFTEEQIREAEAHLYNLHCRSYGPKGLFLDPYEDLRVIENGRRNGTQNDYRRCRRRENYSSSSDDDEEDAQLAKQFLELEKKYKEKEAQSHLVTKMKLEALEAGIKFLGALFTVTGLGNLKIPLKKPEKEKANPGEKPSTSQNKNIPQPKMRSDSQKPHPKTHSKVQSEKPKTTEEDFDLGVFNPAELTRKMKQFISQEDNNPSEGMKLKCKRISSTRLYKHHRRREFNLPNSEPIGRSNNNFASRNRSVARSKRIKISAARFNPLTRPQGERTNRQNQQDQIQKRVLMYRQNPAARRVPNIIRKQVTVKKVEAKPLPPSIDLPPISLSSETDMERNQRLLELSNATSSQSIRHQMMRNSCIDDLFQSSLFHNKDV